MCSSDLIDLNLEQRRTKDAEVITSTYLLRTLGHHKDTPALAPFLGQAPKRRSINTFDKDQDVDINLDDSRPELKVTWHIAFIGTVLVLVLKNEHFVKFFIPILSQVIGTIKYSKIPSFCCCNY